MGTAVAGDAAAFGQCLQVAERPLDSRKEPWDIDGRPSRDDGETEVRTMRCVDLHEVCSGWSRSSRV
jgi:hypothetical protein